MPHLILGIASWVETGLRKHTIPKYLKYFKNLKADSVQVDESGGHVLRYVDNAVGQLWEQMTKILLDEFDQILHKLKWPDVNVKPTREWTDSFEKLLDLQTEAITQARGPIILLPIGAMAEYYVKEFRYHFMSSDK